MGVINFVVMLIAGIVIVLFSYGMIGAKNDATNKMSRGFIQVIRFLGWTLILFSLYDRFIAWVIG